MQKLIPLIIVTFIFMLMPVFGADNDGGNVQFKDVKGWNVLNINMTSEDAKAALKKASVKFEEKVFHKTGLVYFTIMRDGWEGTIYFDENEKLVQILFQSKPLKTLAEAEELLKLMEKKYGSSDKVRTVAYTDGTRSDAFYTWHNKSITLELTVAKYIKENYWIVWENYSPADKY